MAIAMAMDLATATVLALAALLSQGPPAAPPHGAARPHVDVQLLAVAPQSPDAATSEPPPFSTWQRQGVAKFAKEYPILGLAEETWAARIIAESKDHNYLLKRRGPKDAGKKEQE